MGNCESMRILPALHNTVCETILRVSQSAVDWTCLEQLGLEGSCSVMLLDYEKLQGQCMCCHPVASQRVTANGSSQIAHFRCVMRSHVVHVVTANPGVHHPNSEVSYHSSFNCPQVTGG
jgi:hypothetical protein